MKPSPSLLAQAKAGNGWCSGCGQPSIHPSEKGWKKRCSTCFMNDVPASHCNDCGDPLHLSLVRFLKAKKYTGGKCFYCRNNETSVHPVHGVKCPTSWYASLSSPSRS